MPKRTLAILAAAAFGALALPFGLPTIAAASGPTYTNLVLSPLPIAQPGTLNPSSPSTNTVLLCVQPQTNNVHVGAGAQVFLSIDSGLFTSPVRPGGSAVVGSTTLTATPAVFTVAANCTYDNADGSGTSTEMDAVPVTYTGPNPVPVNGRDVIVAADAASDVTGGQCNGTGVCNTGTYVFSPVASYVFNPAGPMIAPTGTLTAGQAVTFTVTALDDTSNPVPGVFMDISLTSTAVGGSATVVNTFTSNQTQHVTNSPVRLGATNAGSASITYTAADPLVTDDTDTITIQNHPTETVENSDTYAYGGTIASTRDPYTPVTPFRVCDTRPTAPGISSNQCNGVGEGPIGSGATRAITVDGLGGVPASGVDAVVLNVTAIAPSLGTYLTLYPVGVSRPGTSNVNPAAGEVVANLVEVAVGTGGQVDLFNAAGTTNVALDVEGYVASSSTGLLTPLVPTRICDTRATGPGVAANQCNTGGLSPIGAGGTLTFDVHTAGDGIPATGVSAVVFNLTAIGPTTGTVLTAFPGPSRPTASNLNVNAKEVVPNRVIVPVSSGGTVTIWNGAGSVNVAVDVNGWFGTASGADFTPLTPARICNTQDGNNNDAGCTKGLVAGGTAGNINVAGIDGVPTMSAPHPPVAVVVNVTAVNAIAATFLTVYPGPFGATRPNASDLNVPAFETETNLVVVEVGSDGTINLYNALGATNFIVDIFGYYS